MEALGAVIEWKQGSYVVKYPDPTGSGTRFTLFVITRDGYFYVGWLARQLERVKLNAELGLQYTRDICSTFPNCTVNVKDETGMSRYIKLTELKEHWPAVRALVETLINNIQSSADGLHE